MAVAIFRLFMHSCIALLSRACADDFAAPGLERVPAAKVSVIIRGTTSCTIC